MGYLEDVMYAAEQTVVQDSLSVTLIFIFQKRKFTQNRTHLRK